MQLQFITETKCPICGNSDIISERIEPLGTHTNGGKCEHRKFACGQEINYVPCFERTELSGYYVCQENDEYKQKVEKRKIAKGNLIHNIRELDTDEEYKRSLYKAIKYTY